MDDFSLGKVNTMSHTFSASEEQIWLWHYRLGHPLFSHMKHLFPTENLHQDTSCLSDVTWLRGGVRNRKW